MTCAGRWFPWDGGYKHYAYVDHRHVCMAFFIFTESAGDDSLISHQWLKYNWIFMRCCCCWYCWHYYMLLWSKSQHVALRITIVCLFFDINCCACSLDSLYSGCTHIRMPFVTYFSQPCHAISSPSRPFIEHTVFRSAVCSTHFSVECCLFFLSSSVCLVCERRRNAAAR